jgi:hypothetical protein
MEKKTSITFILWGVIICCVAVASAQEWSQFRGPNGAGISNSTNLPVEFGPEKNLVWKADLPGGLYLTCRRRP